jgi:predicted transcriptional regulator
VLQLPSKNSRSNLGINVEILKAVKSEVRAKPTRILQRANLSHERLTVYLDELVSKELICMEKANGNRSYCVTSGGERFLQEMVQMEQVLMAFGLSL